MYNEAFRTGDAEHLNLSADPLQPETLDSIELELHYQYRAGLFRINLFNMEIDNSIVWNTDALTENKGTMKTKGIETSWSYDAEYYSHKITLSHYRGTSDSTPSQLAKDKESYLGLPTVKLTWQMSYQFNDQLNISPGIMYENEKYWRSDINDLSQDKKLDKTIFINLAMNYQWKEKTSLQVSVHNLLNDGYYFPQAYGQVLYPGDSREVSVSIQHRF